jgi:hypothetical protein
VVSLNGSSSAGSTCAAAGVVPSLGAAAPRGSVEDGGSVAVSVPGSTGVVPAALLEPDSGDSSSLEEAKSPNMAPTSFSNDVALELSLEATAAAGTVINLNPWLGVKQQLLFAQVNRGLGQIVFQRVRFAHDTLQLGITISPVYGVRLHPCPLGFLYRVSIRPSGWRYMRIRW